MASPVGSSATTARGDEGKKQQSPVLRVINRGAELTDLQLVELAQPLRHDLYEPPPISFGRNAVNCRFSPAEVENVLAFAYPYSF